MVAAWAGATGFDRGLYGYRSFCTIIKAMKLIIAASLFAATLAAQSAAPTPPKNPIVATSQALFGIAKSDIMRSLDRISEDLWVYQPTPDVRTMGQLFAHVADGQYEFCGATAEGGAPQKDVEHTAKTKADVTAALKEAFAYCDAQYAKMTDASAAGIVDFFGRKATRIGIMDFNIAHTMEHYGNLVTYMRLKGIVPPSSSK